MADRDGAIAHLRGASKSYGALRALDGIDLSLRGGELLALLGPNGAGKTTAIGLLLGLRSAPMPARSSLFGMDPQRIEARRHIGVMLQDAQLPATLRVGEIRLAASYYPSPRGVAESAELAGVADLLQRPYGKLSGGQQRRVQFALALCGTRACCSSTNPPSAWTSGRGRRCGGRSGDWSTKAIRWCSPPITWRKPRRWPTACA